MRLVIARCSVDYAGRLSTHLPPAVRLLIVKADGSVLVHTDGGGYKPLNWMSAPCTLVEEPAPEAQEGEETEQVWRITNRSGETMTITVSEVLHDSAHQLGPDPGLVKDGVEKQLQVLLSERCHVVRSGLQLVRREYPTDIGPVDLLRRATFPLSRAAQANVGQRCRRLGRLGVQAAGEGACC
jgi:RecB family endonuclease NucS